MCVRSVSERVSLNLGYSANFTCDLHKEWGEALAARTVVNTFLITNNKIQITWLETKDS